MSESLLFTSESVTEGHPDKVADQVSDAILDEILRLDPEARVACETLVTKGLVVVAGEITTRCYVDIRQVVRRTVLDIGYTRAKYGFDGETCAVLTSIDEQSPDIAVGVDGSLESRAGAKDAAELIGAGDQGMMFGFACDETPELMPLPLTLAHRLTRRLAEARKTKALPWLRPDGKSQVTMEYRDGRPARVDTVVVSCQHRPEVSLEHLRAEIVRHIITPVIPPEMLDEGTIYLINPTGRFTVGGPQADTGLTGRKPEVDSYGGMARHGGGAFSGKDPTKVDRSGAYAARHVAKNIVAAGLARRCEVQVAYAIGVARPVSLSVNSFGTSAVPEARLLQLARQYFDLRPAAIIERFALRRPIYRQVAAYGHFGRPDLDLPWERTDVAAALRAAVGR
ncbi:MAG: methionine adenosyltransferase [Bacillota bacterium]|nr:methionine adenosyltransferase [Bacillota bacterium]